MRRAGVSFAPWRRVTLRNGLGVLAALAGCGASTSAGPPAPAVPAPAGPAITMTENDLDGDTHDVARGTAEVDINSRIAIAIHRTSVVARLSPLTSGTLTSALVGDYVQFQLGVTELVRSLAPLQAGLHRAQGGQPRVGATAAESVIPDAAGPTVALMRYARGQGASDPAAAGRRLRFREALNKALDMSGAPDRIRQYEIVREAATDELERLRQELQNALAAEGVKVMMGAWIGTGAGNTPLHLPGFDDYVDQPRYEVDRFRLVFTEEQQRNYQKAQEVAGRLNEGGGAVLKEMTLAFIEGALANTLKEIETLRAAVEVLATQLKATGGALSHELDTLVRALADGRTWLDATLTSLREAARSHPADLPRLLTDAVAQSKTRWKELASLLQTLESRVAAAAAPIKNQAKDVLAHIKSTRTAFETELTADWDKIQIAIAGHQINAEALSFGAQVKRFDVFSLPTETDLDLELAGQRLDGDQVIIKLAAARKDSPTKDLEVHRLVLRRVLVHVETSVGLVFAAPIKPGAMQPSGFQAAPFYSAFLKTGIRGSAFWNKILMPGLGVSVTALDFNRDGTPEVGIGGALSMLRDWLQGGVGYNLFQRQWYAFVGVGLPLPTFGFTVSSPKTTSTP
jgi:hypothetical protein